MHRQQARAASTKRISTGRIVGTDSLTRRDIRRARTKSHERQKPLFTSLCLYSSNDQNDRFACLPGRHATNYASPRKFHRETGSKVSLLTIRSRCSILFDKNADTASLNMFLILFDDCFIFLKYSRFPSLTSCHARRGSFAQKLQHFLSFKYIDM